MGGLAALAPFPAAAHENTMVAVELEPDHVVRGGTIVAMGADFFPGDTLDVRFVVGSASQSIGTVVAGPDGHFTADIVIPNTAPIGPAALDFVSRSGIVQRVLMTVDPGPPIPGPDVPGEVGADGVDPIVAGIGIAGAVIVSLGALLVLRRRQGLASGRRR